MHNIETNDKFIKIFDDKNMILFYPNKYLNRESCHFCYDVLLVNCDKHFFQNVFSNIFKYKEIKLDGKNKKYNFRFAVNDPYPEILYRLEYIPVDVLPIYIKSYRDFGFTAADEDKFEFVDIE